MLEFVAKKIKRAKSTKKTARKILRIKKNAKTEEHRWLVTSALPYVNNIPHLGNIVGSHLPADIFARFLRLFGKQVIFVGGTDEHGSPTEVAAYKSNLTPQQLCDKLHPVHKAVYDWFGISYDNFSRTSRPVNHINTKEFFSKLLQNDLIIKKKLLLPYCEHDNRYLPDRWVEGVCPHCGYKPARGDQCTDGCGKLLDPQELIHPYCVICKHKPVFREVEHLFFNLTKLSDRLEKWIKSNKHWKDNVRSLALGWIKEGLKPRCITRNQSWGIRVPLKGFEDKVFYVWFDAPIGYISATIELFNRLGKPDEWKKYWTGSARIVHFIGKDNIPFHTIFWPAMLMGVGEYALPYQIGGMEYLKYEGDKISKSKNWGIFLEAVDNTVKVKVGSETVDIDPDLLRFYLAHIMPESKDSDFVWNDFKNKTNSELIGNFGNFVYRVLSFTKTNFNGFIPKPGKLGPEDKALLKKITQAKHAIQKSILELKFKQTLQKALELSTAGNQYLQSRQPWKTLQSDPELCATTIYVAANLARALAIIFSPFVPFAAERLWKHFNFSGSVHEQSWDSVDKTEVAMGHKIGESEPLFKKLELDVETIEVKEKEKKEVEIVPEITFDQFKLLDLRVGRVVEAERIEKSNNLLRLTVDFGKERRQSVAGLAQYYQPEQLLNHEFVFILNLEKRIMMGFESQCMIFAADDGRGNVVLIKPEREVEPGSKVK